MIEPRSKNFHEIVLRSVSRYQIFFHSLPTMTLKFFYRFNQSGFHNFNSASLSISGDNSWEKFWHEVDSYPSDKQQLTKVAANLS